METTFKIWETSRKRYSEYLDKYTLDQLNKIPTGFNNNLIWNIGHIIVAQQALIYKSTELPWHISDELFNLYKSGTKPMENTTQEEVDNLKILLTSLIEKTRKDFNDGIFLTFNERMTGTGFHLGSLTDAFEFNNYHEALHLGFMMNIRKFV